MFTNILAKYLHFIILITTNRHKLLCFFHKLLGYEGFDYKRYREMM